MADGVLVNSNFTAETFLSIFTSLQSNHPRVLSCDASKIHLFLLWSLVCTFDVSQLVNKSCLCPLSMEQSRFIQYFFVVLIGGYDDRLTENKEHHLELCKLAEQYNLNSKVTFVRSFSDAQKLSLLNQCSCLIYTPSHEHFGIVPIEAMYMKRPVIAVNSGGPLETVQNGVTGFLCNPDAESFALAMKEFLKNPSLSSTMGEAGKENVIKKFSFDVFAQHLHSIVCCLYLLEFDVYQLD